MMIISFAKPGNGVVGERLEHRECLKVGWPDLKVFLFAIPPKRAFTLSKASEVEASMDVDEAARKRGWSRGWPDHRDQTALIDDHDHDHGY